LTNKHVEEIAAGRMFVENNRLPKLNRADVNHYLKEYTDKYSHLSMEAVVTKHQGKLSGLDDLFEPMDVDEEGEIPSFDNFFAPPPEEVQELEEPQVIARFIPDELQEYPSRTRLIYECHMKPRRKYISKWRCWNC
jgi:hypothetical protein